MDDVATPLVGFRCWVLQPGEPVLKSVAMRHDYPAQLVAEAQCLCSPHELPMHVAPHRDCRCGLYARTTVEGCIEEYPYYPMHGYWPYQATVSRQLMAMGAVLMWGITLRGRRVIRAQYARVLCLTEKPNVWAPMHGPNDPSKVTAPVIAERQATLDAICRRYGVPMVPFASVTTYAAEYGDLVGRKGLAA